MVGRDGEQLTLKIDKAMGLLGIGREKTRLLCNSGVIPSLRLGRRLVIPKARFLSWLAFPPPQDALVDRTAS